MDMNALRNYANGINEEVKPIKRTIVAKVVGVTFNGRQELLSKMVKDTDVFLERDRRNEYDPFAVKVMAEIDEEYVQVGFIPKAMARKIANQLDGGLPLFCTVSKILGGTEVHFGGDTDGTGVEKLNYGLEILISPEQGV